MSLNRNEWKEMWIDIKIIEKTGSYIETKNCSCEQCKTLNKAVNNIKTKIQQVIGQME